MFENIKSLRPYFHSLRDIQDNVSLDLKLPLNWIVDEILEPYRSVQTKVQDKNNKFTLISIISTSSQEGYDVVFSAATEVIRKNIELEEKERLFREKVKELEMLFKVESLDKLKELTLLNDEQKVTTSSGVAEKGDGEGSERDRFPQESDDKRVNEFRQERYI